MSAAPKYWELFADQLHHEGWSWGTVSYLTADGREMHSADAHRGDGRRFIVHAEDKNTAFTELASKCRRAVKSAT